MRKNLKFLFAAAMLLCGQSVSAQLTYTHLASTKPSGGENATMLIDGNQDSKWGEGHQNGNISYVVFKTSSAIRPTNYILTNANDTHNSKGRQWVKWNIYGGNFVSDVVATKDAEGWVLLDKKEGIGEEQFPTAQQFQKTTFTFSESVTVSYQYYKIEVIDIRNSGDYMQMGDFAFGQYTTENAIATYTKKVNLAKAYDTSAMDADDPLVKEYNTVVKTLDPALSAARQSQDFTQLDAILTQLGKVQSLIATYAAGTAYYTFEGYTDWGDGQPEHLLDGNNNTKWGCNIPGEEGGTYIIFRGAKAIQPFFYNLVTGGDTQSFPGRNWKTWTVYGANFDQTIQATRDAEGWVVLDKRENIGQDLLPARNQYPAPFSFGEGVSEPYYYFMIEVAEAYEGRAIQMSELLLGTEDEFNAIKQEYLDELNAFVVPAKASLDKKAENAKNIKAVEQATPETILAAYTTAKNLQSEIFAASAKNGVYQLANASDLVAFAAMVNNGSNEVDAVLTADIDMSGVETNPIGNETYRFKGTFDGQGYTISNLTIDQPNARNKGLIGTCENATIKHIMLKNARIVGNEDAGGIVGDAINSVITSNAVVDSYIEGRDHAGTIAGRIRGNQGCTLSNNYSNSEVYAREYQAGGILGVTTGGTVENNLFLGTVKCEYTNGAGLVSLIDGNEAPHMLQNNAVFGKSVDAPNAFSLMNQAGRECNYKNNYSLDKCLYNGGTYGLTNPDDVNGGQVDWIEATTKSFYEETLGWDMENEWKFLYGGLYPILSWMEFDGNIDLGVNIGDAKYATLAIPVDVDFSTMKGIQAFAAYQQGRYVMFEPITAARHGEAVIVTTDVEPETIIGEDGSIGAVEPPVAAEADKATVDGNIITIENGGIVPGTQTVLVDMSKQGWENRQVVEKVNFVGGQITFSKTGKSNDAAFYTVPEGVRMYANNVMTITANYGEIAKVVITCDTYDGEDFVGNETRTIEQSASSITITNVYENEVGGVQLRVKTIEITFAGNGTFAIPFSAEAVEANPINELIPAFEDVVADGNQYMLAVVNDVMGFYPVEEESTIPAGRGYLEGNGSAAEGVKAIRFANTETAIESVENTKPQSNVIYDLTGRRVVKALKGIYIINGKKVLK